MYKKNKWTKTITMSLGYIQNLLFKYIFVSFSSEKEVEDYIAKLKTIIMTQSQNS